MTRRAKLAVALATVVGLAGCKGGPDFGLPRGATTQGKAIFSLWQGLVITALAVGAIVWALIFFVVIRYRRRRNGDAAEPSQRQYIIWLEIAYTLLPLLIVAVLFYFTVETQTEVTRISAHPSVRVEVTAFQWGWRFHYVDTNITVTTQGEDRPVLMLPEGKTTRITLIATDVIHNFFVPGFLYKRDAIPGLVNNFDLTPTRTGTFLGRCAEFCGLRHSQMLFDVKVVAPDAYQQWLTSQGAPPP
ncbi:MAG: cytochrome c oxidase subunit II [Actinomycetota bacterium]|nr:cytochrome c oxidase subunit II [Actinomycetota bacterium]